MDLSIKCKGIDSIDFRVYSALVNLSGVDNTDEIIESLVDECDPASLVTSNNKDGILDYIGVDYVMEYFGLKQEKEDYGMRDGDFM